jgi:hypothetical protein
MAHYKVKGGSRLATRTTTTDHEWLRVCSQIGVVVNNWAFRNDLVVYGGEDTAEGQAIAAYYADISEIEVDVKKAFGTITPASMVGDFRDKATQYEYPMVSGIVFHEALHARHTNWDTKFLAGELDATEQRAFMLLEESRIEAKGILERPENKLFLRASALEMALEGVDEKTLGELGGETWQVAQLAGLSLARYDSGILARTDVAEIYKVVVSVLGEELYEELRKVWCAFQKLGVPQVAEAITLSKKWVELLRQADPEGEPQSGESPFAEPSESESESGEGEGEKGEGNSPSSAVQNLIDKMSESSINSRLDAESALADQEKQEKWNEESKARQQEAKNNNAKREQAKKIFDKAHNETGSGSNSRVSERRKPTGAERASAVSIAKALEKAKYRERSVHVRKSHAPVGKLIVRNAVANKAMESMGLRGELPEWKSKTRKHTDDPTLKIGVMVDISGSMGSAMNAMGTTAWVMSEAGRRIQAKTAMVYFGSGVFPTLRVGQRMDEVVIYTAPDGTEKFGEAFDAIDGELGLTFSDGVRLLVVVSDGQFTPVQQERTVRALTECKRNGVAVLWITPKACYGSTASHMIRQAGWGVHLDGLDTEQIASMVGKTASEALGKVGSLT